MNVERCDEAHGIERADRASSFAVEVDRLYQVIVDTIREPGDVHPIVERYQDAVYVKAADGQLVLTNRSYEEIFAGPVSALGRFGKDFLDATLKPASRCSDQLIISGCTQVEFEHYGRDANGRSLVFRTLKRSLLGAGHPKMAILGVTRILEVTEDERLQQILSLSKYWYLFSRLHARDREVAGAISRGEKIKTIAARLDLSEKTIENRRAAILAKLSLETPLDLVKLLVRFQDNGFADFGL